MKERETFGSRLGFILVSAGCAVGLGNVWKFPYMTGKYGGAAFILIYLVFLVLLGLPILVSEFVPGEAAAAHGGNENAQRNGGAGKHANQGIRRLIGAASDKGKQQGKHHAEANRRPDGGGHAADNADGDARKGGVSQSVGEKAHAPGDDHGGENAEQRRHEQQRQQGVFHKVPVEHFKGKRVPNRVPDTHARPPLMWKVRWNSSESSTVCGSP